jgi:alpha-beta hydrolase superfamily lysophospholipase
MRRLLVGAALAGLLAACSSSGSSTPGSATTVTTVGPTTTVAATTTAAATTTTRGAPTTTTTVPPALASYAVSTHTVTLVDPSRSTPANAYAPGAADRTLPTLLVYPAAGDASAPRAVDAPPAEAPYGFPLVVFAHGLTGSGRAYLAFLSRLAAAGFVVAAPDFPLSKHDAPGGATAADYKQQPGDMRFVIDQVLSGGVGEPLPAIDGGRVAVAGHSLGGVTVLGLTENSCCHDDRIKAAVAISGFQGLFDGTWHQPSTTPLLLLHGDHDQTVDYQRSAEVYAAAASPVVLVRLLGAPHIVFGPPWGDVVVATMLDFLRAELDGDSGAGAALTADGNQAGVATIQQR